MPRHNENWSLLFVLPHLSIEDAGSDNEDRTLGQEGIAVVRADDPRVSPIAAASEGVRTLISSFRNEYGEPMTPAVLIAREHTLTRLGRSPEGVVAFRNILALSDVLLSRAGGGGQTVGRSWTDSYDFHVAQPTLDPVRIDIQTPAVRHYHAPIEKMVFTADPGLPRGRSGFFDREVARRLGRLWNLRYMRRQDRTRTGPIFRSLEIAYHAASIRFKNYGSIYEAGVGAILWASAVDVLAGQDVERVDRWSGLGLIGEYCWTDRRLRRRAYGLPRRTRKAPPEKGNLAQYSYSQLYEARNRFVHGNPVTSGMLRPFRRPGAPPLLSVASTLYRAALAARLNRFWPESEDSASDVLDYLTSSTFENHLLSILDGDED